jgi:hypothetical protein
MTDLVTLSRPGRSAARSDALQNRDLRATYHSDMGPASAAQRCVLQRVRDTEFVP